jgi:hypothetical protein
VIGQHRNLRQRTIESPAPGAGEPKRSSLAESLNHLALTLNAADIETGWRYVVANAAEHFLPKISMLTELQGRLLRYTAQNPKAQPFSQTTAAAVRAEPGSISGALDRLVELELLKVDDRDGRKRIWVHDARLAFYLRA